MRGKGNTTQCLGHSFIDVLIKVPQGLCADDRGRRAFLGDLGDDEGVADEDGDVGDELDEDDLGPHHVQREVPLVEADVWKDAYYRKNTIPWEFISVHTDYRVAGVVMEKLLLTLK